MPALRYYNKDTGEFWLFGSVDGVDTTGMGNATAVPPENAVLVPANFEVQYGDKSIQLQDAVWRIAGPGGIDSESAEPLASVAVIPNHASGTVTYTMTPKPGQTPTEYLFGAVGLQKSIAYSQAITIPHPLGTFTPEARAIVGGLISEPITGAAFTLVAPLSVTGTLSFTTGAEATQGETLAWTGLTIVGGSVSSRQWTDDGVVISGQTGDTLSTAGITGVVGLTLTIIGADGTSVSRSASVTVSAPSATAPSAPLNVRIGTTALDGVPLIADAPVSAGSTAITGYEWTITPQVGSPIVMNTSGLSVLVTALTSGTFTASVRATNGEFGPPSAQLVGGYSPRLGVGFSSAAVSVAYVSLSDIDRSFGSASFICTGLAGGTVVVKDSAGTVMAQSSTEGARVGFAITTQRGLWFEVVGNVSIGPYRHALQARGTFSAPVPYEGGSVTVTIPNTYTNAGGIEVRYGLAYYSTANGTLLSAPSYSTDTTFTIPSGHIGHWIGVSSMVFDTLRGVYVDGVRLQSAAGGDFVGPITAATTAVTVNQSTSDSGISTPIGSIPGFVAANGVRITVTAATDSGSTGGFWVAAHTSSGETIGLTTIGVSAVGSAYEMAPPTAVLPEDTDAIIVGPAGAGTFSYTLSLSAVAAAPTAFTFDSGINS